MRYRVFAVDYDGTLAQDGTVTAQTCGALERLLGTGRRLVLATGRRLKELLDAFPRVDLFEWVVAENGALLYRPSSKESKLLGDRPNERFVQRLRERGVRPLAVGESIIAAWQPHQHILLETIQELGLDLQVIFNKNAVMVLPSGVNKASGLAAALREMGMSLHNAVGVGDAENDHPFLKACEFAAAVANALPAVKAACDWTAPGDHGAGVEQLIERIIKNDLEDFDSQLKGRRLSIGESGKRDVSLSAFGPSVLLCGPSGSGKSTVVARLVESMLELQYQFCLIDPEGDYETFEGGLVLGSADRSPMETEVLQLLSDPLSSAVVNLTGLSVQDRPPFFLNLFAHLQQMRSNTGRPHWLILDEAHHLTPADWEPPKGILPERMQNTLFITTQATLLPEKLLHAIDTFMFVGPRTTETIREACEAAGLAPPDDPPDELRPGELFLWRPAAADPPTVVAVYPCKSERRRHRRKYAEGELSPEQSFYFAGPQKKLNLRAQNLKTFLQLADGVDDETWEFHRKQRDYSTWLRGCIKDEDLASEVQRIESLRRIVPDESRRLIREAIERDYVVLVSPPMPVPGAG